MAFDYDDIGTAPISELGRERSRLLSKIRSRISNINNPGRQFARVAEILRPNALAAFETLTPFMASRSALLKYTRDEYIRDIDMFMTFLNNPLYGIAKFLSASRKVTADAAAAVYEMADQGEEEVTVKTPKKLTTETYKKVFELLKGEEAGELDEYARHMTGSPDRYIAIQEWKASHKNQSISDYLRTARKRMGESISDEDLTGAVEDYVRTLAKNVHDRRAAQVQRLDAEAARARARALRQRRRRA